LDDGNPKMPNSEGMDLLVDDGLNIKELLRWWSGRWSGGKNINKKVGDVELELWRIPRQ
jgi:hypothetical protein